MEAMSWVGFDVPSVKFVFNVLRDSLGWLTERKSNQGRRQNDTARPFHR